MATEAEMFEQGGRMVREVGGQALQQSGGFFTNLFMAPINLVGSMAKKTFGGIFSYGPWIAGGTALIGLIAPDLIRGAGELTGRTDVSDKTGADIDKGGPLELAKKALLAGAIGGGAVGAASGAWQTITGGVAEGEAPPSTGARLGSAFGTVATVGLLAVVGAGLFKDGGVAHDASAGDRVETPPMPKPPGQTQQALDA